MAAEMGEAKAPASSGAPGKPPTPMSKAVAVRFLHKILEDADDSDSESESEAEQPAKPEAKKKSEGKAPERPPLRRTRSALKEEAEKLARATALSLQEKAGKRDEDEAPTKEKRAARDRRRVKDKGDKAKKKKPADDKEKHRHRADSKDDGAKERARAKKEEAKAKKEEAKTKKEEAKKALATDGRRLKPASEGKSAADKDDGAATKKLRAKAMREGKATARKKTSEDAAPSKAVEKVVAESRTQVTPSPIRKRSRIVIPIDTSPELTKEQKEKKENRRKRSSKLKKRRQVWTEDREAKNELKRALEERDRAESGDIAEDEVGTALLDRESADKMKKKRKRPEGADSIPREEKSGERKVLPHKKRRKLSGSPADSSASIEATRDAKHVTPLEDDRGKSKQCVKAEDLAVENDAATTSQEDSTTVDEEKASDGDSESRKAKISSKESASRDVIKLEATDGKAASEVQRKPASLVVSAPVKTEEGQVHEDGEVKEPKREDGEVKKLVKKSSPDVEALADLSIPKKSSTQSDEFVDLPIPRRAPRPSGDAAASFVIPKRSMKKLGIVGASDGAQVVAVNGSKSVLLSSSRMIMKPRVAVPDILKAVVQSAPSALVRPARRRTKQQVPSEVTTLGQEERAFIVTAKKRRSLVAACLSSEEFSRGPTPYDVFDTQGRLVPDLTPRLTCPTHRHLSTNRDEFPASFFGVGLPSPKANVKSAEAAAAMDADSAAGPPVALNCYEPLVFTRPEDRESYQRKMYGTSFVPQLIKGRTTLIMRNARYERKSRGIRFNADRDREDYAQVLSQRFKKNKSVPICEIPRDSWRKMSVEQRAGMVYLHFNNREDAMLAALEFVDDNGVPLEWKREYRAGIVLTANVSPVAAPRRSLSSERGVTPAMSPEGAQHGSERGRDRDRDFRNRRRDRDRRGPPPRERSHYGDGSIMQRSPSGIDYRSSFTTPTNNRSELNRGRDADRPRRESRSRSRSRSHSTHAAASRDGSVDGRKRLSVESGEKDDKAGMTGEDSRGEWASTGNENTGDSSKASQDGVKSAESGGDGASSVERDVKPTGDAEERRTLSPPKEEQLEAEAGELPIDDEHNAKKEKPRERDGRRRHDEYPNKRRQPDYNDGRWSNMDPDGYHGVSNGSGRQEPPHRWDDGRSHRGGRSRSRDRPRNPESRRDWERDGREPRPPMDRNYEPRRHGDYYENGGRGRDGGFSNNGYRDDRHHFPPPPPLPPRDARHHDYRRY